MAGESERTTLVRVLKSGDCIQADGPAQICMARVRRKTKAIIRALPSVRITVGRGDAKDACNFSTDSDNSK